MMENSNKKIFSFLIAMAIFSFSVQAKTEQLNKDIQNEHTPKGKHLNEILNEAAKRSNSGPLESAIHNFEPQGLTAFIILEESHISIHSWPECNYVAIDVFTCGEHTLPHEAVKYLEEKFLPQKTQVLEIPRGIEFETKFEEVLKTAKEKLTIKDNKTFTNNYDKKDNKIFGQELILDLYDCDHEIICSGEKIKEYTDTLCDLIEMKKFGKPFLERFAEHSEFAAGYSVAQMIETSLVSGHFSEFWNRAYINIFSCKDFDANKAKDFTKDFFKAKEVKIRILTR